MQGKLRPVQLEVRTLAYRSLRPTLNLPYRANCAHAQSGETHNDLTSVRTLRSDTWPTRSEQENFWGNDQATPEAESTSAGTLSSRDLSAKQESLKSHSLLLRRHLGLLDEDKTRVAFGESGAAQLLRRAAP